ncbi:type II secretion system F family protein [Gleimia europaea]|uniref:type II secretion system F family protein n=1 Tax=Gleimia europaea TaxID=66228 RepID=UPI002659BCA7|nr:type II secretion system F family protein [Gleimia europaea]MDK7142398.1 type II secretion system F family protein [Gleimia europaea]
MLSWAILTGCMFSLGVLMTVRAVAASRERLVVRVLASGRDDRRARPKLGWISPLWEKLGSTAVSVTDRLDALSSKTTLERFRLQQFLAGIAGVTAMTLVTFGVAAVRPVSILQWIVMMLIGFVAGAMVFDRILTVRVNAISRKVSSQVADAAELLALSVSAGESVPAALRRVQQIVGPELATQLGATLEDIDNGASVTRALGKLRRTTRSPQLGRLLDTLVASMERGAPLATTLREQARDLRDEARRALMESGGKREVAMLFPVVFIILPVTVVFALYPGLVALRF